MMTDPRIASRQVDWFSVHQLVVPVLDQLGSWPLAGSPAWQQLDDRNPRKWAAILDAGQHWALKLDTDGQHYAQASRAISEAEDWVAVSSRIRTRSGVYIPRRIA